MVQYHVWSRAHVNKQILTEQLSQSIYAFEAIPQIYEKLKANFNGSAATFTNQLRIFNNAVSDTNGQMVEVHSDLKGRGGLHNEFESRGLVKTITFDYVMKHHHGHQIVDYVVIDVEGWEEHVLRGMTLEQNYKQFPMFQVELGGTWVDKRHSGNWTQADLTEYL
eukprot:658407_1